MKMRRGQARERQRVEQENLTASGGNRNDSAPKSHAWSVSVRSKNGNGPSRQDLTAKAKNRNDSAPNGYPLTRSPRCKSTLNNYGNQV